MTTRADLIGKRFGRLEVINFFEVRKKEARWRCRCDCGNEIIASTANLNKGHVTSCKCLQKEICRETIKIAREYNKLPEGESEFRCLYRDYRSNSEKKNRTFNLSLEEFRSLASGNCFYCGVEPFNSTNHSERSNGKFIYNGIDRVDNEKGYEKDNVVSCCKICNHAKHTLSQKEFMEYLYRITRKYKEYV